MLNTFRALLALLIVCTAFVCSAQETESTKPKLHVYRLELDQAATMRQKPLLEQNMKAYNAVQQIEIADKIVLVKGDKTLDMDRIKDIVTTLSLEIRHYTFYLE